MMRLEDLPMKKATQLSEMLSVFSPFELEEDNFSSFYVDVSEARGTDAADDMKYFLSSNFDIPKKILFVGHSGTGKSTELNRVKSELVDKYEPVSFSVAKDMSPNGFSYIELIFMIARNLIKLSVNYTINENIVNDMYNYWNNPEFTEVTKETVSEIDASLDVKLSFVQAITAKLTGIFKTGETSKTIIKEAIEPNMFTLITQINDLIECIQSQMTNKRLLIIVEDIDKLDIKDAEELFIKRRKSLVSVDCNMIFTLPIYLYYSPYFNDVRSDFDMDILLSTIKVRTKEGERYEKGINTLKDVVLKRTDSNLISDEALDYAVIHSGGSIRTLFTMIQKSVLWARKHGEKIELRDIERSYLEIKSAYERQIKEEHINCLKSVYINKKPIVNSEKSMEMLSCSAIIEYNGERWCGLHPAVYDYLLERGDISND